MKLRLLIFCLTIASFSSAQSPWVRQAGSSYVHIAYSVIPFYDKVFTGLKTVDYVPRKIKDEVFQFYSETGITNNTTLIVNIPYLRLSAGELTGADTGIYSFAPGTVSGLGNIQIALRKSLFKKQGKLMALQTRIHLPSGHRNRASGLTAGYDNLGLQILYSIGKSNKVGNQYVFGYAGAQYNTNRFSSYVHAGAESGIKWKDKTWFIVFIDLVQSLNNGIRKYETKYEMTYTYVNNQNYGAYGGKISTEIIKDKFGMNAAFAGGVLNKNVAKKPSFNISAYLKIN